MPFLRSAEMRVLGDCTRVLVPLYWYGHFLVLQFHILLSVIYLQSFDDSVKYRESGRALQ
jgi:hypothetical protein